MNKLSTDFVTCPHCGAENTPYSKNCWICQRDLAASDIITAEVLPAQRPGFVTGDKTFLFMTAALGLVLILPLVGLWRQAPGAAITLAILLAPVLIATLVRGRWQFQREGKLTWQDTLVLFLSSLSLIIAVLALIIIAALVAFFLFCLGLLAFG